MEKIKSFLKGHYGINVLSIRSMTTGVGGDTYLVTTDKDKYVFKVADTNEISHPEREPEICNYLLHNHIGASQFCPDKEGHYTSKYGEHHCHLQYYIEGTVFKMNTAPEWFMQQSPVLLGRIHNVLEGYCELPIGIGKEFFKYMTLETAKYFYQQSLKTALERKETDIIDDLEYRIKLMDTFPDMKFDADKLTYRNTHGDFTINQIICEDSKMKAVIDWTSACRHPVIWELTRSFFYAEPSCKDGDLNEKKFEDYVNAYCSVATLNEYDKENLTRLYYYQLAVCDYYSQYLNAEDAKKEEFLLQARFATKMLRKQMGE